MVFLGFSWFWSYPGRLRTVKVVPEGLFRQGRSVKVASGGSKRIRRAVPEGKNRIRKLKVVPGRVLSEGQNGIREGRGRTREGQNRIRRAEITSGRQSAKPLDFP